MRRRKGVTYPLVRALDTIPTTTQNKSVTFNDAVNEFFPIVDFRAKPLSIIRRSEGKPLVLT